MLGQGRREGTAYGKIKAPAPVAPHVFVCTPFFASLGSTGDLRPVPAVCVRLGFPRLFWHRFSGALTERTAEPSTGCTDDADARRG